ncbi:MAG: GDSL-type esterase/lipase family protein [Erysipelotrichaceae bacterium]|nr:GDSL-type esterase/lipase family protein [Erysipelotrichaceae bacterium]
MKWVSSIKYLSTDFGGRTMSVTDMTLRLTFSNNLNGDRLRIRLTNRYAPVPLTIAHMTAGIFTGTEIRSLTDVTLHGRKTMVINPDEELFSDDIALNVRAGDILSVSVYFKEKQDIYGLRSFWSETGPKVLLGKGDHTDGSPFEESEPDDLAEAIRNDVHKMFYFFGFDAVQVYTHDDVHAIAAFGDSITHMSYFTNALTRCLYSRYPGRVSLLNCGIGGNRLVHDASCNPQTGKPITVFGEAGVNRFERNVFEIDQPDTVLMLIGINDIMHPLQFNESKEPTPAEELIAGYRRIAETAHRHHAEILIGTIMPCGNNEYPDWWMEAFEKTRQKVNSWIRTQSVFDDVMDYDALMRDEENPRYLKGNLHLGDGLHPNDSGGEKMTAAIDLNRLAEGGKENA